MNQKRIFTNKEASDFLRVSEVTLWRERKKGNITFRRVASKIVYLKKTWTHISHAANDLHSILKIQSD